MSSASRVTVVISEKGWVRTLKGHVEDISGLAFKTDDKLDHAFFAETTSKLLLFATNGKFYSLDVAKLPGGRGHGEPIRMFIDMEQDAAIVSLFVNKGERKFLIASSEGQGFVVKEEDCVGNTRKGKQVLNVDHAERGLRDRDGGGRYGRRDRRPTTRCCCSRSTRCRRWRAAAACACRNIPAPSCPTSPCSSSRRA